MEITTFTIGVFAALFSVVNPLGAMPVFLSMTATDSPAERAKIARKTSIYFIIILVISFFIGIYILDFFGVQIYSLRIAGGLIILSSGYALLEGNFAKSRAIDKNVKEEARDKEDVSLTPLAIPMLAGPGSISYLIALYAQQSQAEHYAMVVGIIIFTGLITYLILRLSPKLVPLLGASGMNSVSRIIGFIVMAIGIEYIVTGIRAIVKTM